MSKQINQKWRCCNCNTRGTVIYKTGEDGKTVFNRVKTAHDSHQLGCEFYQHLAVLVASSDSVSVSA